MSTALSQDTTVLLPVGKRTHGGTALPTTRADGDRRHAGGWPLA